MRHLILMMIAVIFITSCGQNDTKQKELELKEKELALKEKELNLREKDTAKATTVTVDTVKKSSTPEVKAASPDSKTLTMVFKRYEEGDNMYLIFTDTESGKEYSFENPDEKKFNGIKIYVPDAESQFEVKANPKYINKKFIVDLVNKSILSNGPGGSTVKKKAWVINGLKLAE